MLARIFEDEKGQFVQLPEEMHLDAEEMVVNVIGDMVMLMPKKDAWDSFKQALDMFSEDYMEGVRG